MEASKFQATHHSYIRKQLLREVKASGLVSRDLVMEDTENVVTMNTQPKSGEKIEVFFVVKGDYNGVRKAQTSIQSVMDKGIMHKALISYDTAFFDVVVVGWCDGVGEDQLRCAEWDHEGQLVGGGGGADCGGGGSGGDCGGTGYVLPCEREEDIEEGVERCGEWK